jgi:hypothetical protein
MKKILSRFQLLTAAILIGSMTLRCASEAPTRLPVGGTTLDSSESNLKGKTKTPDKSGEQGSSQNGLVNK